MYNTMFEVTCNIIGDDFKMEYLFICYSTQVIIYLKFNHILFIDKNRLVRGDYTVCMALNMDSLVGGTGSGILGFTQGSSHSTFEPTGNESEFK